MTFVLPKRTCALWQIRIVMVFALVCAAFAFFSRYTIWFLLPAAVSASVGLVFAFAFIPFYFKSYKITIDDGSIIINKGVIFKVTNIMPFPRLVYAQSFATPISTAMKIKGIMLKAARAWIFIPEIDNTDADILLENLRMKKK